MSESTGLNSETAGDILEKLRTTPATTLQKFLAERLEELSRREEENEIACYERKVVSLRLKVTDIHLLDQMAKKLDYTRSGMATEILENGIEELRAALGIPYLPWVDMSGDATTTVIRDQHENVIGVYQDDALQIGEEVGR